MQRNIAQNLLHPLRSVGTALLVVALWPTVAYCDFPAALLSGQRVGFEYGRSELECVRLGLSGDTFVMGNLLDGVADVYVRQGTNWLRQARFDADDTNQFGYAESATVEGDTVVVGSPFEQAVYLYVRTGTNWTRQAKLTSADELFGSEVDLDGDTLLVGASAAGTAYVFVRDGTNWTQQARLVTNSRDREGGAALDGDTVVIADGNHNNFAGAFVFVRNGTNWTQQAHITAMDTGSPDMNRRHVDVSGDTIAVGEQEFQSTGRVYIFTRNGTNWTQQARLTTTDAAAMTSFARYVTLKGNVLVTGAVLDNEAGTGAGAAYLFERNGTSWFQIHKILPVVPGTNQYFGSYVALDGQNVAVATEQTAVDVFRPEYSNVSTVGSYVRGFLYRSDAAMTPGFDEAQAAFRYKDLLYSADTNDVRAQFELMSSLYGQAERDRADYAESELARGLAIHPDDAGLGNLLLDIYYDRTEAETIFGNNVLARAMAAHFPSEISDMPPPSSGFVIDNEIPLYEQALQTNRLALSGYFSLFTNSLGVGSSPPLGYQIFTNLVPGRGLMPASYYDTNGMLQSVTSNSVPLFDGYKDVVLLFDQLQSYGETATTLGKLLLARDGPNDRTDATNVVGQAQQLLFLDGTLLKSMFATLPGTNDPSGLAQSIDGWSASLSALNTLQQNLTGGANLLGFSDDFLMYVYSLPGVTGAFNSYDALYTYLNPGNMLNSSHPLSLAASALQAAKDSYSAYRGYQDQLADQMTALNQNYTTRLRDIVGASPGDPSYGDNPTNNPGSLLDQQYAIIQQAKLNIKKNQTEISNLKKRVEIEINRASSVSNVVIKYGNKNAKLTEEIGYINGALSFLNGIFSTVSGIGQLAETAQIAEEQGPVGVKSVGVLGGLNAVAQGIGGAVTASLEAQKERNAAMQQATITGIDSAAAVKTMMLDMNTLLIESDEAALQLQQAVNQLMGLYREKQQLEQKIARQNASLASRYYADPIHRLLAQADMADADLYFNNAQRWLFFTERALAYKWNTPLNHEFPLNSGTIWTEKTLFKLRNADELNEMFNAMNDWDASLQSTLAATQTNVDYFSVRDDFFGYAPSNSMGQTLTYPDPITGQLVSAKQAFRDRLRQLQNNADPQKSVELRFSTVRQIPGKSFFQGPVFGTNGVNYSRGLCLDKIQWIKINLPGAVGGSTLQGTLTYGGTSFIRNLVVGTFDPAQPDHLLNEMTAYSTRHWYFSPDEDVFTSEEAQPTSATMQLSTQAGVAPTMGEIDAFNERSVATSDWELRIPTTDSGTQLLNIDQLDDIEIWFRHIATGRISH